MTKFSISIKATLASNVTQVRGCQLQINDSIFQGSSPTDADNDHSMFFINGNIIRRLVNAIDKIRVDQLSVSKPNAVQIDSVLQQMIQSINDIDGCFEISFGDSVQIPINRLER